MNRSSLITGKPTFVGETQLEAKVAQRRAEPSGPGVMRPVRCDSARQLRANAPTRMGGRNAMVSRPDPPVPADLVIRRTSQGGDLDVAQGGAPMTLRRDPGCNP
jgi:hypothetical protein